MPKKKPPGTVRPEPPPAPPAKQQITWVDQSPPQEQLDVWAAVIEQLRDQCVKLGLAFVERKSTVTTARRFFIMNGNYCLVEADDPSTLEFYLYGWRDCAAQKVDEVGDDAYGYIDSIKARMAEIEDEAAEGQAEIDALLEYLPREK